MTCVFDIRTWPWPSRHLVFMSYGLSVTSEQNLRCQTDTVVAATLRCASQVCNLCNLMQTIHAGERDFAPSVIWVWQKSFRCAVGNLRFLPKAIHIEQHKKYAPHSACPHFDQIHGLHGVGLSFSCMVRVLLIFPYGAPGPVGSEHLAMAMLLYSALLWRGLWC